MKQTAVEWLFNQMSNVAAGYVTELNEQEILNKAKEMEKEQIMDARLDGFKISGEGCNGEYPYEGQSDALISNAINNVEYYNETFKSE